jgi:hypothetical protein
VTDDTNTADENERQMSLVAGIGIGAGLCFLLTMIPFDLLGSIPFVGLVLGWFGGLFSLIATVFGGLLGGFVAGYLSGRDPITGLTYGGAAGAVGGIAGTVGSVLLIDFLPSVLTGIAVQEGVVDTLTFAVVRTLVDPSLWVGIVTGPLISIVAALLAGLLAGLLKDY